MKSIRRISEHATEVLYRIPAAIRLRDAQATSRFRVLSRRYRELCNELLGAGAGSDPLAPGYDWGTWVAKVRRSFDARVPARFLSHPIISFTMVFSRRGGVRDTPYRVGVVRDVYGEAAARRLLREDPIGGPTVTDLRYLTSANRAHHAMHLAEYRKATGGDFWDAASIVEWGGGYGNMARLIRRMNAGVTYTIIDLPEISALQYVYLGSLEGEDALHIVDPARPQIRAGRINLLSVYDLERVESSFGAGAFISTWALTESPVALQQAVAASDFYDAKRVLIASMKNENNALYDHRERLGLQSVPVPAAANIGPGNEYWFR